MFDKDASGDLGRVKIPTAMRGILGNSVAQAMVDKVIEKIDVGKVGLIDLKSFYDIFELVGKLVGDTGSRYAVRIVVLVSFCSVRLRV